MFLICNLKLNGPLYVQFPVLGCKHSLDHNKLYCWLVAGKQLIVWVSFGATPPPCCISLLGVVGAAQTQTCRHKLVVSVNTSSDLRVWGREQMTSHVCQCDEAEEIHFFTPKEKLSDSKQGRPGSAVTLCSLQSETSWSDGTHSAHAQCEPPPVRRTVEISSSQSLCMCWNEKLNGLKVIFHGLNSICC